MNSSPTTKSIGGVARCVLHLPSAIAAVESSADGATLAVEFDDAGIAIPLKEGCSLFVEQLRVEQGLVAVTHRLEAVIRSRDGAYWLDADRLRSLAGQGAIAEVVLSDGRRLIVGWSQRFGAVQPLRLASVERTSGRKLADEPTTTIVLTATDTAFALPIT